MNDKGFLAVSIFILVYTIIVAGENSPRKLDRPAAGLLGSVLMVLTGVLTRSQALAAIHFATLGLLFGMMILIHYVTASGLLDRMALRLVGHSHGPKQLLWMLCLAAGVLSALFVNDTICLLMTPLVLCATRRTRIPAEPYLLALATSSNVGSVMTLTGNPQNMLIGQSSSWSWGSFALRMAPIGLVCLLINAAVIHLLYRKELRAARFHHDAAVVETGRPLDRKLAVRSIIVLTGLLTAFLFGMPMDLAALTAAVALMILANRRPEEALAALDWSLLLFFAGLFVVVAGITRAEGAWIPRLLPIFTRHTGALTEISLFSGFSIVGSNLFSNVPFVMLLRGWIAHLPHAQLLWLMLAASSTFAGNLTLVGSVANLIVARRAGAECPLSFLTFLRVGVPTTVLTIIAATIFIWIYGLLGWA